jgi:hypothetical protein
MTNNGSNYANNTNNYNTNIRRNEAMNSLWVLVSAIVGSIGVGAAVVALLEERNKSRKPDLREQLTDTLTDTLSRTGEGIESALSDVADRVRHLEKAAVVKDLRFKLKKAGEGIGSMVQDRAEDVEKTFEKSVKSAKKSKLVGDVRRAVEKGAEGIEVMLADLGDRVHELEKDQRHHLSKTIKRAGLVEEEPKTDVLFTLLMGLGVGAMVMYFLDPHHGSTRRDQVLALFNRKPDAVNQRARDFVTSSAGQAMRDGAAGSMDNVRNSRVANDVLAALVRAEVERHAVNPNSVQVTAMGGQVILSGTIRTGELNTLIDHISRVPGVESIDNRLTVQEATSSTNFTSPSYSGD